jgi:hypothetical protein
MIERDTHIGMRIQATYSPVLYNSCPGTERPCYWSGDETQSETKGQRLARLGQNAGKSQERYAGSCQEPSGAIIFAPHPIRPYKDAQGVPFYGS